MSDDSGQPEPGRGTFAFSNTGPIIAFVTTLNGAVEFRNSPGNDTHFEVTALDGSADGQAEADALMLEWMVRGGEPVDMPVDETDPRPKIGFTAPFDVARRHPLRVRMWLPQGSAFSVGSDTATVSADGRFTTSNVYSHLWRATVELRDTDHVTTRLAEQTSPARTVLRVDGASGEVGVYGSRCPVAVNIDGPTTVREVDGDVDVVNKHGATTVENIRGSVRAQSDTGDLTATNLTNRLDFHTTSGTLTPRNVGTPGDYVRLDDGSDTTSPEEDVESELRAIVGAAQVALGGAKGRPTDTPANAIDLPLGGQPKGVVQIGFPGSLPSKKDGPRRQA